MDLDAPHPCPAADGLRHRPDRIDPGRRRLLAQGALSLAALGIHPVPTELSLGSEWRSIIHSPS